jgi:glutaredoxin
MGKRNVFLFALSTCPWCAEVEAFLADRGVNYDRVYVDRLEEPLREMVRRELERLGPERNFPTLLVGKRVVPGFRKEAVEKALREQPAREPIEETE